VLRHQFGQNLVLGLDLLFQIGDPILLGGVVGPGFLLEGRRAVLKELLLPAVEDRGLESKFIAKLRDRLVLQQMPPEDGDLLFRRVVLPLLLHAFSPCTLLGERLLHFRLNRDMQRWWRNSHTTVSGKPGAA